MEEKKKLEVIAYCSARLILIIRIRVSYLVVSLGLRNVIFVSY